MKKKNVKYETFSNENLYKGDNTFYKMNKYHKFENQNEEALCNLDLFARNFDLIKFVIILMSFFELLDIVSPDHNEGMYFITVRVFILCCLLYAYTTICFGDNLKNQIMNLRIIMEMDILITLISLAYFSSTIIFMKVSQIFIYSATLNVVFSHGIEKSLTFYLVEGVAFLLFFNVQDRFIVFNLFWNILEIPLLASIMMVALSIEFVFSKIFRELWALFDSFKRSYSYMKGLHDNFPFPIIIVTKSKIDSILSKNEEADKLYKIISSERKGCAATASKTIYK